MTIAYPTNPPEVSQRQTDLSESPWFYLVILAVLVLEQAMAVHLSFHLKGSEANLPPDALSVGVHLVEGDVNPFRPTPCALVASERPELAAL